MEYFHQYLIGSLPIYALEFFSSLAGLYYLKRNHNTHKSNKYLVYFLWFTVFVEVIGVYAPLAYFTKYKYFSFIEDTVFEDNYWWYNIYTLFTFSFFIYYFSSFLKTNSRRKIFRILNVLFLLTGLFNLFFSDIYFKGNSVYTDITGTFLVLLSIILFYFDLLKSKQVMSLKKLLPVYISIGILVYCLIDTPLVIFSQYFKKENGIYIKLSSLILLVINIFMYSTFIIGFLVCAKNKNINIELNE